MGRRRVGPQAIREYLGRMRERYELAERTAKGRLLDEVCEMTGYHRKAVIRLLGRPAGPRRRRRGGPRVQYGPEVVAVLRAIWTAAGYPWSVRLKALLPLWLPWARRHVRLTDALEAQVRRISPRQIDRCLRADEPGFTEIDTKTPASAGRDPVSHAHGLPTHVLEAKGQVMSWKDLPFDL